MHGRIRSLTEDEKIGLTGIFWVLIRNIRRNDKISPDESLKQFTIIFNNVAGEDYSSKFKEFIELNDFYTTPKLENEVSNIGDTLLERKKLIHDLLAGEAASLKMQRSESIRLKRRSASFSSSFISTITRKEVRVYWVYIEFEANEFIKAILENNEKKAHDCIFKQEIPLDSKCYELCEDASKVMSSTAKYLNGLYLNCLLPLRLSIEVNTNYKSEKEAIAPTLKQLDSSNVTILSCFIGNKNFKEEFCNHANNKDSIISNCSANFIAEYKHLSSLDILYVKDSLIIKNPENKTKEGCSMC